MKRAGLLAAFALLPAQAAAQCCPEHFGVLAWKKRPSCRARLDRAMAALKLALPRYGWHFGDDYNGFGAVASPAAIIFLVKQKDPLDPAEERPRRRTATVGPWQPTKQQYFWEMRREGGDLEANIHWDFDLDGREHHALLEIVQPALDFCLTTFDPVRRVVRWEDTKYWTCHCPPVL